MSLFTRSSFLPGRALRFRLGVMVVGELAPHAAEGSAKQHLAVLVAQRSVTALAHAVLLARRLAAG